MARDDRYHAHGKVYIAEVPNTEALLKNLSVNGLCIQTPGFMEVVPKTRFSLNILPEEESNLDEFNVEVESRWIKAKMQSSESGFAIVFPPGSSGKEALEQYLRFLATQGKTEKIETDPEQEEALDISSEDE